MRRKVTLSLPKSLLQRAKLAAVRKDKSLSEFMKDALEEKIRKDSGYKKAKERQVKLMSMRIDLGTEGSISISREELHERA